MTTRRMLTALVVGLVLGAPGAATAQFNFTPVDVPGAASTAVNGNSTTAVVGEFDDEDGNTHGFVYSKGVLTQIDVPGARWTTVNCVNSTGEIVGVYGDELGDHDRSNGFVA